MRSFLHIKNSEGVTLIELAAVITVVGIAIVGLSMGYYNIVTQFESDTVRNNLVSYGNTFMQEIAHNFVTADYVDLDGEFMGYSTLVFSNDGDLVPYLTVKVEPDGKNFNIQPSGSRLSEMTIPNKGDYVNNGKRLIRIKEFKAQTAIDSRPNMKKFNDSFVTVLLEFEVIANKLLSGQESNEIIKIEREIFMPKNTLVL